MPRKYKKSLGEDDAVHFHERPLVTPIEREDKKPLISPRRSAPAKSASGHHPKKPHTRVSSEIRRKHQQSLHRSRHESRQRHKQQVDDVVHHLVGLRKKDSCHKKIDRHTFKFVKCGVQHYNKTYREEDGFVPIPVKPDADSDGYELFDDIMTKYLRTIAKRK